MNYIVMECHTGFAVLLDENGRFVKAANLRYRVGDTVTDPVLMNDARIGGRKKHNIWPQVAGVLAACLTLILGILIYQYYTEPVSTVVLRINPDVQIDLNRGGKVVALEGLNLDGMALLRGYDSHGKELLTVSTELIGRAIEQGCLTAGDKVTFSIDAVDDAHFEEYGILLRRGVSDYLDGRLDVILRIYDNHTVVVESESENKN